MVEERFGLSWRNIANTLTIHLCCPPRAGRLALSWFIPRGGVLPILPIAFVGFR